MNKQTSKTGLKHRLESALGVLLGQSVEVGQGTDSSTDQPWDTNKGVDTNTKTDEASVPVVSFSVSELVGGVVKDVKSDTVIQEDKDEGQGSRDGSEEDSPGLSVKVEEVDEPVTASPWFFLFDTLIGPVGLAGSVTASESRGEGVRYVKLLGGDVAEETVVDEDEEENRDSNGEVGEGSTNTLVAEEGREFHTLQLDSEDTCTDGKDKTQEGGTGVGVCGATNRIDFSYT